jgi:NAD(P)-dependent dehydrogenase (short-subunit alcohol dehydrogenase family)
MDSSLKGKTILITGAAGGLGSALAVDCARAGSGTVLLDNDRAGLERVYDHVLAGGFAEPSLYPLDLLEAGPDHFAELVEALKAEYGGLDALVHCAASFRGLQPIDQIEPSDWLQLMQVNLNAAWLLSVSCGPLLRQSGSGRLYFLLDDLDRVGGAYWGAYGVSKHALKGLVSQFAAEYSTAGVQVLGIDPGSMRSRLRAEAYHAENPSAMPDPAGSAGEIIKLLAGEIEPDGVLVDLQAK